MQAARPARSLARRALERIAGSSEFRLDRSLWEALERPAAAPAAAAAELKSVNAQIECLLREALHRRGVKLDPPE